VSALFRGLTASLTKAEELIKEIRVIPVRNFEPSGGIHLQTKGGGGRTRNHNVCESLSSIDKFPQVIMQTPRPESIVVTHTLWSYYFGLGEYERTVNDTPVLTEGT
jgi:hypothetical protein